MGRKDGSEIMFRCRVTRSLPTGNQPGLCSQVPSCVFGKTALLIGRRVVDGRVLRDSGDPEAHTLGHWRRGGPRRGGICRRAKASASPTSGLKCALLACARMDWGRGLVPKFWEQCLPMDTGITWLWKSLWQVATRLCLRHGPAGFCRRGISQVRVGKSRCREIESRWKVQGGK